LTRRDHAQPRLKPEGLRNPPLDPLSATTTGDDPVAIA
jgi:hypothetical protein